MKSIIPYEKEIKFDTKIAEVTSISLEHEDKISSSEISGDFIISGEYKIHSISVNKESFKYRLPFSIELSDKIIRDSIKYDINDFTYDLKSPDILVVKIEVILEADEIEEEQENFAVDDEEKVQDNIAIIDNNLRNDVNEIVNEDIEEQDSKNIIMNNVNNISNTYITYHVHLVTETDSIESICSAYKINKECLVEYNNLNELKPGIKLLIPEIKDE